MSNPFTLEDDAALLRNERDTKRVAAVAESFNAARRPKDEAEAEVMLNSMALLKELAEERIGIINAALRRWDGYKDYATMKRGRAR